MINIPSLTTQATIDGVTATLLSILALASLFYFRKKNMHEYLLLTGIAIVSLSLVLTSVRAVIPTGYRIITENQTTTITYIYGRNPFALIYTVPLALGTINTVTYVIWIIKNTRKLLAKTKKWG